MTGAATPPWLRISRYDRIRDRDGALARVHQEDMAQALRLYPFEKYQSEQSDYVPSISAIAQLLQAHAAQPAVALSTLLDKPWTQELALAVGERATLERITRADWERMAADLGMPAKTVLARLEEKAAILPGVSDRVLAQFVARHGGNDDYEQMLNVVGAHCRQALDSIVRCAT